MIVEVEVNGYSLVRTFLVAYSLMGELPPYQRLLYKGVTRKMLRDCVQRVVLILPMEERNSMMDDKYTVRVP